MLKSGAHALFVFAAWLLPVAIAAPSSAQENATGESVFSAPEGERYWTDDGTVALEWAGKTSGDIHEVRRWDATDAGEGVLVYEGLDTASFLSGLAEGEYEIRLRSKPEGGTYPEWEESSLSVTVEYTDRGLVVMLMSAGFVTFLAIVGTIAIGHRQENRDETPLG